jgi:hypothetical protein
MRIFTALLFLLMAAGCSDSPTSYVKKLDIGSANVSIDREGMLSFSVPIKNKGSQALSNVPITITCNVTVTGSTPQTETFSSGPIATGERKNASHEIGPFPIGIYTQPSCTYSIKQVEF